MKGFKDYITEMAFMKVDQEREDEVMLSLKELGDAPLIWRGQIVGRQIGRQTILYSGVVEVTMAKESFRGAASKVDGSPSVAKQVVDMLGFENKPVFCTHDKSQSKFFGNPGVVVPQRPYTAYWNNTVRDLVSGIKQTDTAAGLIKGYHEVKNSVDIDHDSEILIDCNSYYWITVDSFFDFAKKSKFNPYNSVDAIRTYADLLAVYKSYKSYLNWYKNRNK